MLLINMARSCSFICEIGVKVSDGNKLAIPNIDRLTGAYLERGISMSFPTVPDVEAYVKRFKGQRSLRIHPNLNQIGI